MATPQQLAVRITPHDHSIDAATVAALVQTLPTQTLTVTPSSSDIDTNAAHSITVAGITGKRQQLALACLLHWALNCPNDASSTSDNSAALEPAVAVALSDCTAASSWIALHDALGCTTSELALTYSRLHVLRDDAAFIQRVLVAKVQVVDCRPLDAFLGLDASPTQAVAGHFDGAWNVPVATLFAAPPSATNADATDTVADATADATDDAHALLPLDSLRDVLVNVVGIDLDTPVATIAADPRDAALVATSLVLAGHTSVVLSLSPLCAALVAAAPTECTTNIFHHDQLVFATDGGAFDLSPPHDSTDTATAIDAATVKAINDAYAKRVSGTDVSNVNDDDDDDDDKDDKKDQATATDEVVYVHDGHRFFDLPAPITKRVFLDASLAIYRVVSFVLAPFGFPTALHDARTLADVQTQFGALFQDAIEVCSDLVYGHYDLNEGAMATSVHKWVERKRDRDCSARVREINDLWAALYDAPAVVEVPDMSDDRVLALATQLYERLEQAVRTRAPWAFDEPSATTNSNSVDNDEAEAQRKLSTSWQCMYPSVVYTLGFIPTESAATHRKLSTLQIKSFIQAVADATWSVMRDANLSQIEFQALCDTVTDPTHRDAIAALAHAAEPTLYVVTHFLTRAVPTDETYASSIAGVRAAVADGDRRRRAGQHAVALASYAKAFAHLPLFHRDVVAAIVGRAQCLVALDKLEQARAAALTALRIDPFRADAYACLGAIDEQSSHVDDAAAMQHFVTAFVLDGSRSPAHAEAIDRVSRRVGRAEATHVFAAMVCEHALPSSWLTQSYFDAFEHDADATARVPFDIAKTVDAAANDLDADLLLMRAVHHKRAKRFGDAQRDVCAVLERSEQLTPEHRALALNLHASFLYVAGDVHAALDAIAQSIAIDATVVNALVKQGGFLAELGDVAGATECFEAAAALDPNSADVYLHWGQMALLDGDYAAAVQTLRRAMSRSDALAVTHVSYGMALYKSGSVVQANDVFNDAVARFPASPEVHLFQGEVLADQGNYAGAMHHFLRAFELSPACPLPFLNAGRVYVGTNDPMRAIAHFEHALAIDPRCSAAHLDIAQVLFAQGRTRDAFAHFDVAATCCRFLPEVEEVCACRAMAKMQLQVTEILGVELRHIMRSK